MSCMSVQSVCGARNLKKDYGFIVGGNEAPAHSWPWAVAVYTGSGSSFHNYKFVCGASVISERYVLGAAHCVSHNSRVAKPETIRLLIGAHDRRYEGVYHRVQRIFVHKLYDERLMQNDIALYKLAEPINFNKTSNIAPVCLPDSHWHQRDYTNQMVQLVGWGTTSAGGRTSDILRQVQVPIITNKDCARSYNALMVTSKQMCAGYAAGKRDSCQGDSGGPMTMQLDGREGRYVQIGITSWGKGCAEPKYPGVYTKVSYYIDWIQSNTNNVND
ncbi:unnamed protein product [Oppiella nova]|uniref:Peptidase S1 domain-containing protein n=1 Tax=Oppiella nova TaxID=334625 RepID=A0A7R9LXT1_9ACAR|nr:unnamed protein product [Oppiella nova]CAG2167924.1 unnamed protein product [Oppiella nova]